MELFAALRAEREAGNPTTLKDWLDHNPLPDDAFTQSIAGVARRVVEGEPFLPAVRELLDEIGLMKSPAQLARAIEERPTLTGDERADAYLAALAEHLSARHSLERPAWTCEAERFLDRFWFPSAVRGFRPLAIAESPAAFRRRGIFIALGSLDRC